LWRAVLQQARADAPVVAAAWLLLVCAITLLAAAAHYGDAIARALANRPALLLADEPTGQLDSETGHRIMQLLRTVVGSEGITAVVATHDPLMLDVADRVVELRDRRIAGS